MSVMYYQSSQTGAPQIAGQPNTLIAVLNACLVNGFNLRTLTSLTRNNTIATVTVDAGHGFKEGEMILLAGATQAAYNGLHRIHHVTTNQFQFDVADDVPSPATGSLTAKIAPLGWDNPFVGTNKAVYRSKDITSNRLFLRVNETPLTGDANYGRGNRSAIAQQWETLNDIDHGTATSEVFWRKAQNETNTPRPWLLVGDAKRFWLAVAWSESYPNRYALYGFGDLISFKVGDAFGSYLAGYYDLAYNFNDPSYSLLTDMVYPTGSLMNNITNTGIFLARSHTQLGSKVNAQWVNALGNGGGIALGVSNLPYPNPADNGIYVVPLMVQESEEPSLRGRVPGLLCPLHPLPANEPTIYDGFVIDGSIRRLLLLTGCGGNGASRVAIDITGPW